MNHDVADPYRWLEDLDGERAAQWVRDCNSLGTAMLARGDRFESLRRELRQVLDAGDRIPVPTWHGGLLYNLWTDAEHPRGLWRRTTLDEYRKREPDWQVLLDLDELAAREGESWVWQGADLLRPDGERALVMLSRGGADAAAVREFDTATGAFVDGGFTLPEAKSDVAWIDRDTVYVGTDFGPGSLTSSGYPRQVRVWRRGTPLAAARPVYEGHADDVVVHAWHDPTPGYARGFIQQRLDFFRAHRYLHTAAGGLVRIEVPDDADADVHRDWLVIRLRTAWTVGDRRYPAGALLGTRFDDFLAGGRDLALLFEPDRATALRYHAWTRQRLILVTLRDVRTRVDVLTPGREGWERAPLAGAAAAEEPDERGFRPVEVVDTNADHSDEFLLASTGFLHPGALLYGTAAGVREGAADAGVRGGAGDAGVRGGTAAAGLEVLKEAPAFFDAEGMSVRQYFATSHDGTRVPYFVVGRDGGSPGPTLLSGYGGFEISRLPAYSGVLGRGWMARGGTYAVANIRGGGEYGPAWHHAALRAGRPRAYEDFAAVAADLVERGVTTPGQLGAEGGSNGGLLTGVMLTRYPRLFGAIVCQVPLLDMRRYHELLAGASWIAEYGNPDDEADWAYLRDFSPYHNVRSGQKYPAALFVTSTRDDRVHPGHARKMVARLREYGYDVTYYENVEGGHGAAADNEQQAFRWALVLEFLWRTLGERTSTSEARRAGAPAG